MRLLRFPFAPVLALMLLLPGWTAFAAPPDQTEQVKTHLEFQGYTVTLAADRMVAKHSTKLNINLKKFRGGILVTGYLGGKVNDRLASLEMVNKLNADSGVTRVYLDKDGDWTFEAWIPGYDKAGFAAFLTFWDQDTMGLIVKHKAELQGMFK
ncbi:MAG: hypothetical protein NTY38_18905 [Acidobacteria bacterium]|nr:hypothetical protein [Acidobacteriota bacterium]